MAKEGKKYYLFLLALALFFSAIFFIYLDWQSSHRVFTFAMLDVGQGDALFVESPAGVQILIDGGPDRKVLGELAKVMPPFDRILDAVIITNPDQDHIGGLPDVLENYQVGAFFEPGTWNESRTYRNLEDEIKNKNIPDLLARKGMVIDLGDGAIIDILFPNQDVTSWLTNDGSVVARISYGDTQIMLTGDATIKTERIILSENSKEKLASDILKVGHHGSNTSSATDFLDAIAPTYALISVGKDNKYGHPKQEVLNDLESRGIKIFRTDQNGTIILKSDGKNEKFKFLK